VNASAQADLKRLAEQSEAIARTAQAICPTPESVLADVVADLAISVSDLALCHASDGFEELELKLRGIAVRAMRAIQYLGELDAQGDFERIALAVGEAEAADLRRDESEWAR
jgi:hypothetical protein